MSFDHNFLFIHVPRTAGTSMEQAPFIHGKHGHIPFYHYEIAIERGSVGFEWDDVFKWAFVRDPFDRFISSFEYAKAVGQFREDESFEGLCDVVQQLKPMEVISNEMENEEQAFVKEIPKGFLMEGMMFNLFIPQSYFLIDSKMKVGTELFRFENIDTEWKRVCDRIGVKHYKLPVLKKTEKRKKSYWTKHTKNLIRRFYKMDFDLLYG